MHHHDQVIFQFFTLPCNYPRFQIRAQDSWDLIRQRLKGKTLDFKFAFRQISTSTTFTCGFFFEELLLSLMKLMEIHFPSSIVSFHLVKRDDHEI